MLLTKKVLRKYQESLRVLVSESLENELLVKYGQPVIDEEGLIFEYAEQDIYEQVRKVLLSK